MFTKKCWKHLVSLVSLFVNDWLMTLVVSVITLQDMVRWAADSSRRVPGFFFSVGHETFFSSFIRKFYLIMKTIWATNFKFISIHFSSIGNSNLRFILTHFSLFLELTSTYAMWIKFLSRGILSWLKTCIHLITSQGL